MLSSAVQFIFTFCKLIELTSPKRGSPLPTFALTKLCILNIHLPPFPPQSYHPPHHCQHCQRCSGRSGILSTVQCKENKGVTDKVNTHSGVRLYLLSRFVFGSNCISFKICILGPLVFQDCLHHCNIL